jgi:aryl carrier-like protein
LIAYVVGESGREPEPAELRVYLRERLPEYMIPATFVALERLPLSPNGKIDRRALPAPTFTTQKTGAATAAPRGTLEELLARLWGEVLGTDDVGLRNNFFDIGGDSLKAAMLLNRLQEELGEVVYVVVLFDAPTIEGLAVYLRQHYVRAVARLEGRDYLPDQMTPAQKIDGEKLAYLRSLIKPLPPPDFSLKPKNPQAVFILSPPRSGSTLLRVMLAGNRSLFAPPELQLLCCNTLRDRKNVFTGRYSFWLEGTIRAFMDMKGCDAEQAARLMEECEERGLTTQEFYLHMQEELGARKKLVDKTPAYALDFETLKRAEDYFEDALYIHLLRHPNGMIRSFEDAKLDQIFRYEHTLSTRALAESIWTICHQNIVGFLRDVPARRQHVVRFEELVKQPSGVLNGLCDFLGVEYDDAMAQPHREQEKKMTDGIHGLSRMLGDIKFHTHKKVDANIADRWKQNQEEDFLGEVTWEVATSLGYERPTAATAVAHANSTSTALHSKVLPPVIPLARKRRTTS